METKSGLKSRIYSKTKKAMASLLPIIYKYIAIYVHTYNNTEGNMSPKIRRKNVTIVVNKF